MWIHGLRESMEARSRTDPAQTRPVEMIGLRLELSVSLPQAVFTRVTLGVGVVGGRVSRRAAECVEPNFQDRAGT